MNPTHKKTIQIVVGIIVLVILIVSVRHSRLSDSGSVATTTPSMATSSQAQASSTSTVSGQPTLMPIVPSQSATTSAQIDLPKAIIYGVSMDKPSYKQDEPIRITIAIINNTDTAANYNFKNGCQGNYVIDSFDLSAHIRCTESPTAFRVLPHTTQTVKLVHYPSLYKIPVGTHKLTVNIVGYPGVSTNVTVTN